MASEFSGLSSDCCSKRLEGLQINLENTKKFDDSRHLSQLYVPQNSENQATETFREEDYYVLKLQFSSKVFPPNDGMSQIKLN